MAHSADPTANGRSSTNPRRKPNQSNSSSCVNHVPPMPPRIPPRGTKSQSQDINPPPNSCSREEPCSVIGSAAFPLSQSPPPQVTRARGPFLSPHTPLPDALAQRNTAYTAARRACQAGHRACPPSEGGWPGSATDHQLGPAANVLLPPRRPTAARCPSPLSTPAAWSAS